VNREQVDHESLIHQQMAEESSEKMYRIWVKDNDIE